MEDRLELVLRLNMGISRLGAWVLSGGSVGGRGLMKRGSLRGNDHLYRRNRNGQNDASNMTTEANKYMLFFQSAEDSLP